MRPVTVALCQFRPSKGRPVDNLARIESLFRDIATMPAPPDVMVLPEAILTGYFLEGGVREHSRTATALFEELSACHARAAAPMVDICIGFYELHDERLHNSALWATLGGPEATIRHVHRKVFL